MDEAIEVLIKLVDKLQKDTWANPQAKTAVIAGVLLSIDKLRAEARK